ncbi:MAG TPA: DUF2851 family protein [Bacteroides sp.]|nr:DUF2851 family protein [Bacteroides sp.]
MSIRLVVMGQEAFLHFIWKKRLFDPHHLKTTCGKSVEILRTGELNMHAGPDFFNARIKIDGIVWAGNVEIHVHSSDWIRHGHHLDPAFNNVVLHVVREHDCDVTNYLQRRIPVLVLRYPPGLESRYRLLKISDRWLPCGQFMRHIPPPQVRQWLTHLQKERVTDKSGRILKIYQRNGQDWQQTFYRILASGYGLPINSLPFEMTAASIPLEMLMELRESLIDLEAILYGQAGFPGSAGHKSPYLTMLREKHRALAEYVSGEAVPGHLWKFLRLRPASFPTVRISQFASLVHRHFPMLDMVQSCQSVTELEQILRTGASEYWNTHYLFGKSSPGSVKYLGQQASGTLIINTIVPFLSIYGKVQRRKNTLEFVHGILEGMKAESNEIIREWKNYGFTPSSAMESQALIQLRKKYCRQRRCLECQIGALFLESALMER